MTFLLQRIQIKKKKKIWGGGGGGMEGWGEANGEGGAGQIDGQTDSPNQFAPSTSSKLGA